ncbi:hypothetical protein BRDID11002_19350 [Bradyrhizobium diazoefficiens]
MDMVTPVERPDQLLAALRDKLGAAARADRHRCACAQLQRLEREPAANAAGGDPSARCAGRYRCDF